MKVDLKIRSGCFVNYLPILAEILQWCIAEYTDKYNLNQKFWVNCPIHLVECFVLPEWHNMKASDEGSSWSALK